MQCVHIQAAGLVAERQHRMIVPNELESWTDIAENLGCDFRPGTVSYRQYDTISPPAIHHARMLEQAKPAAMIIEFGGMRYAGADPSLVFTGATPPRDGRAPAPRGRWFCSRNIR